MGKVYASPADALAGLLRDGMTIMCGGFGLVGIPEMLILAVQASGVRDLTVISNTAGIPGVGLGALMQTGQIGRMIASYIGENPLFEHLYLTGQIPVEFVPQGTLAERIRAGGAGIPAFWVRTGMGTVVAEGKEHRDFAGETYILEHALRADLALVHAWKGDPEGNLVYRKSARNFNPMMAAAGKVTVAEVEHLEEPEGVPADLTHTPGIYVQRLVHVPDCPKRIERLTHRGPRPAQPVA